MKIKRRIKIITETERKLSVTVTKKNRYIFCFDCGKPTEMLSINESASRIGSSWRTIVRLIESGAVHTTETANGEIYICPRSLSNFKVAE